jgi:hypothetical protein
MKEDRDEMLPGKPLTGVGSPEPKTKPAEATSSETLSDIEASEKVSTEESESEQGSSSAPSPDGAFDSNQDGRAPTDDPGPM